MEDDATPTLAPWWPLSLEDFAESLPEGWEAAQVMYNTDMWMDKTGSVKRVFSKKDSTKSGRFGLISIYMYIDVGLGLSLTTAIIANVGLGPLYISIYLDLGISVSLTPPQ